MRPLSPRSRPALLLPLHLFHLFFSIALLSFNPFRPGVFFFFRDHETISVAVKRWISESRRTYRLHLSPLLPRVSTHLPSLFPRISVLLFTADSISNQRDDFSPEGTNLAPTVRHRLEFPTCPHSRSGSRDENGKTKLYLRLPRRRRRSEIPTLNFAHAIRRRGQSIHPPLSRT